MPKKLRLMQSLITNNMSILHNEVLMCKVPFSVFAEMMDYVCSL